LYESGQHHPIVLVNHWQFNSIPHKCNTLTPYFHLLLFSTTCFGQWELRS